MSRGRWLLPAVFVLLISAPLIGTFFQWDFYPLQNENRPMAEAPEFAASPVAEWPDQINAWYKDHFGFRNTFIRRYNAISRDWFDRQPERVVITDRGWLFTSSEGAMADFMGLQKKSSSELEYLRESLEGRQRWLAEQGIGYLWVIAPNKCVIYPEELPVELQRARARDGIEQFVSYLESHNSTLNWLDMRHALLRHKKEEQVDSLYYSNDTHWTPLGSYFGYCDVIEALRKQVPQMGESVPLSDCAMRPGRWSGDLIPFVGDGKNRDIDCVEIMAPENDHFVAPAEEYLPTLEGTQDQLIVINPKGKGTAVVFHDSFGNKGWRDFIPFHFGKTVFFVAARPEIDVFKHVIEAYRPDIIIEEQVHRMILYKTQPTSEEWIK